MKKKKSIFKAAHQCTSAINLYELNLNYLREKKGQFFENKANE